MSEYRDEEKIKQLKGQLKELNEASFISNDKKKHQKEIDAVKAQIKKEQKKPKPPHGKKQKDYESSVANNVRTDKVGEIDTGDYTGSSILQHDGTEQTEDRSFNADEQVKTLEKGEQNRKTAEEVLEEKGKLKGKKWADILSAGLFTAGNGLKTAVGGEADELPEELKGMYDKYKGTSKDKINEQEDKKQGLYGKEVEDYGNQVKENRDLDTVVNTLNISHSQAKDLLKFTEELGIASAEDFGNLEMEQKQRFVSLVVQKPIEKLTPDDWAMAEKYVSGMTSADRYMGHAKNAMGLLGDAAGIAGKAVIPGK